MLPGFWFTPLAFGFYGYRLRDADGTLPDITGVSISSSSHVALDSSRISFDADNILFDMGGMSGETGTQFTFSGCQNAPPGLCVPVLQVERVFQPEFVLDVIFAAAPEPATTALVGAGLVVFGRLRRRPGGR